ncbi:hypothetical protein EBH_0023990 [Eimeria brunetti]|uniref:Uncharacterized protein n=1 Tax=Eimeria brunetti TaxID=51314 RepID=U6LIM6_9EIME|nr:hypothetical protein EBH_0023990 [Eimeria brunetti]
MLNSEDSVIQAFGEGQMLEIIRRAIVYTPDRESSDREVILAYLKGRNLGCLKRRCKKVDIRSLWWELPRNTSERKTRIETGSGGTYPVKAADDSALDHQHLASKIKQHMAGWQHDVWKDKVHQGKYAAYQTADSNAFLSGPTRLKPEFVFALRACSAQLYTRAYLKNIKASKLSRCRHCTDDPETLAHALNGCPHSLHTKIKGGHNKAFREDHNSNQAQCGE